MGRDHEGHQVRNDGIVCISKVESSYHVTLTPVSFVIDDMRLVDRAFKLKQQKFLDHPLPKILTVIY